MFSKKFFSVFFALTLAFSPLLGPLLAPKAEAQLGGMISGCASGFVTSWVSSFFSGTAVPVDDLKNNIKECLDAVAFALAKTLLAQLTDSIINWINNGFDGNPFYIGDTEGYFRNVIRDELQLAINDLKRLRSVYFDVMRANVIYQARATIQDELGFTLDSAIVSALCGYAEYEAAEFCQGQLTPEAQSELTYAFTRGYIPFQWSTWESLTQNCGNNVFCAGTQAQEYALYQAQERIQQLNTELNRGSGFLSQKVCRDPGFQRDLEDWQAMIDSYGAQNPGDDDFVGPEVPIETSLPEKPICSEYIIQTPGRIIADKLTSNLGTTERQLELADELNESIAAIFDALIGKLINDGLASFRGEGEDDDYYNLLSDPRSGFQFERTEEILAGDAEACEATGGVYDEELGVCDFDQTGGMNTLPDFPWIMEGGVTVTNGEEFATLVRNNPGRCVIINNVRVWEGDVEPCLMGSAEDTGGTASNAVFTINPEPLRVGRQATFTISGGPQTTDFEIVYLTEGEVDPEFLIAGVTNQNGSGAATIQIPALPVGEVVITVFFGTGESVEKTVEVSG